MTTTLQQKLEDSISNEITNGRFSGNFSLETTANRPSFSGSIDTTGLKKVKIQYNPKYEQEHPNKTEMVVRDIARHEINHKGYYALKGCPRNIDLHTKRIIEPIADVLSKKGYANGDFHYVANTLEDTILHADLKQQFSLDGITAFLCEVGSTAKLTPFYEAHVKLNLMLWGNSHQKHSLNKYFSTDKSAQQKIKDVLLEFLKKSGLDNIKMQLGSAQARDKAKITEYLNDEANWPRIAQAYAESFSKLMSPSYAMPLLNHSGKGTKGNEEQGHVEGNEFDKEMETAEYKSDRVEQAHKDNARLPSWIGHFEGLDLLYQRLAQRLSIKAESFTKGQEMPLYWFGKRDFIPEKDSLKHVRLGVNDNGEVTLKKKRYNISSPIQVKASIKGFPEVRFCLIDCSGTMADQIDNKGSGNKNIIPWGTNSKYHHSLLAWYGFLEYLSQNHLLSQTNVSLGQFGYAGQTTLATGLHKSKKLALDPTFAGETKIDADKLESLFNGKGNLVFTVSDGDIHNWDEISDIFIEGARNHSFFHFQIGSEEPESVVQMKAAGLKIVPVKNAKDLAGIVIDLTDKAYREGTK